MKKLTKKIISIMLSLLCLSTCISCKKDSDSDKEDNEVESVERIRYEGTHLYDVADTNEAFIQNGRCDYKIVLPSTATPTVANAATELNYFFQQATGISLPIIYDQNATLLHDASAKYISVGETSLLKSADITLDKKLLGADGVRIATKDKTIYLVGGGDNGTVYSVYTFLEILFNFEIFYTDCWNLDTNVKNLNFKKIDVTDVPDIAFRSSAMAGELYQDGRTYDSQNFSMRMRYSGEFGLDKQLPIFKDYDVTSGYRHGHNASFLLPTEKYEAEHPSWFSNVIDERNKRQLCYTARGDENEFKLMTEEVTKKVAFTLENYPVSDANTMFLAMEDNYDVCKCDKCVEMAEYYGTESAAVIIFMNRVGELVEEWMNKPENANYYREDFKLYFYAYYNFEKAPAKWNEDRQGYEPIDEKVILRDNIGVYYCNINQDTRSSMYSERNLEDTAVLQGWGALTENIFVWAYSNIFSNYTYFYDGYSFFNEDYFSMLANMKVKLSRVQATTGSKVSTSFKGLLIYITSQLSWNTSLRSEDLIDRWFEGMYGDGATAMRKFFDECREYTALLCTENNWYDREALYCNIHKQQYWPLSLVKRWMGYCDETLLAVERYEYVNPEYYQMIKRHVELEWISPAYIVLSLHFEESSIVDKEEWITRLEQDDVLLGGLDAIKVGTESSSDTMATFLMEIKDKM